MSSPGSLNVHQHSLDLDAPQPASTTTTTSMPAPMPAPVRAQVRSALDLHPVARRETHHEALAVAVEARHRGAHRIEGRELFARADPHTEGLGDAFDRDARILDAAVGERREHHEVLERVAHDDLVRGVDDLREVGVPRTQRREVAAREPCLGPLCLRRGE